MDVGKLINGYYSRVERMMLSEWLNKLELDLLNVELVYLNDDECCWYMIIRVGFWLIRWWINSKWVIDERMDFWWKVRKCCAILDFTVAAPLWDF